MKFMPSRVFLVSNIKKLKSPEKLKNWQTHVIQSFGVQSVFQYQKTENSRKTEKLANSCMAWL
jgi:hypothetical protein